MQQVQDDHSQIVQMMSQILASTNNNLPQNDLGNKEPRDGIEITLQACKICEEEGHQQGVMLKMQEARTLCKEMSRKKQ
jgi:hypothetical protein